MLQASFITDCPPDSVEWCPIQRDLFACGTYLYNADNATRQGSIYLFRFDETTKTIEPIQHVSTHGILDLGWLRHASVSSPLLSTVSALGQLSLYSLANGLSQHVICEDVTSDQTLALSHAWFRSPDATETNQYVVVSDQGGSLTVCELHDTNGLRFIASWPAHEYECWTCTWDSHNPHVLYSGADDTLFKIWDLRDSAREVHLSRQHSMGVCSIVTSHFFEHQFLTGSFDEYIRQWDKRALNQPLKQTKLGGGVWKMKYHPDGGHTILCACMQNGFCTVDTDTLMPICTYKEHGSLAYGCDWQPMINASATMNEVTEMMDDCMHEASSAPTNSSANSLIASCSFYDKSVHVWKQQSG